MQRLTLDLYLITCTSQDKWWSVLPVAFFDTSEAIPSYQLEGFVDLIVGLESYEL